MSGLSAHVRAVDALIETEFAIFNERLLGVADADEVARLAGVAIESSSQMLSALHRRRLVRRLEHITAGPTAGPLTEGS